MEKFEACSFKKCVSQDQVRHGMVLREAWWDEGSEGPLSIWMYLGSNQEK